MKELSSNRIVEKREGLLSKRSSILRVFCLFLIVFLLFACTKGEDEEARVVATVSGRSITVARLNDALKVLLPEWADELTAVELSEFKKTVLIELIEEELALGEAVKAGLVVSKEELEREVQSLKESADDESFFRSIQDRYGSVERWKEGVRRKLLLRKMVGTIGLSEPITEEEALNYYKENVAEYDIPEQVSAAMILLDDEAKARAVRSGLTVENFSEVALKVSLSPEAAGGGDLGYFGKGEMPKEFEDAVFLLSVGEISKVIATPYGYHIFLLGNRKKGHKLKFEDVKDEIVAKLEREKADREYIEWMTKLKKEASIVVAADI